MTLLLLPYNGKYGCDRCDQLSINVDEWWEKGRPTYPSLPINMITTFSIDYMHCLLLGVMRKLLSLWICQAYDIAILISENKSSDFSELKLAKLILIDFVRCGIKLYGPTFPRYNVHALLHLYEDVLHIGSIDNCSAFEHHLHIKKSIRGCKSPLVK